MTSLFRYIVGVIACLIMLQGCEGDSGSPAPTSKTATGVFVNVPVQGLSYEFGHHSGITGPGGTFAYEVGDVGVFKLGDISIGKVAGAPVVTLEDVVKTTEPLLDVITVKQEAVKLAQFLLSLDDGTKIGYIMIPQTVIGDAYGARFVGIDLLKDDLRTIVSDVIPGTPLVDAATAAGFLAASVAKVGIGAHAGEYAAVNADDEMAPALNIDPDGTVTGLAANVRGGGYLQLTGSITPDGNLMVAATDFETKLPLNVVVTGKSDGLGTVSGTILTGSITADADVSSSKAIPFSVQRVIGESGK